MQKQFDIIVLSKENFQPPIEDDALGWFFAENFSESLAAIDAEWIILCHADTCITREFLNRTADVCAEFPFADAIAPRICTAGNPEPFSSGLLIDKKFNLQEEFRQNPRAEIRQVASLSPFCGIYSARLLQALGGFDTDIQTDLKFFDLGLRALHLGANLFTMPKLSVEISHRINPEPTDNKELARIYYKDADMMRFLRFTFWHPSTLNAIWGKRKGLDEKSLKVTEISKLSSEKWKSVSAEPL